MSVGCDKCGDTKIYQSWRTTKLCRYCFEDLYADAKLVERELEAERERDEV